MMIAMAITCMIGAAVAAMVYSASYGTSSQDQLRNLLVAHEMAELRTSTALRSSMMVLAKGDDYVVLWTRHTRDVDSPNLSELQRIEIERDKQELRSYQAPADLPAERDTKYDLAGTDFGALTATLRDTADFPGEPWASDVTDLAFTFDTDDPRSCELVGYRTDITVDGQTETAIGCAALRN